MTVPRYALYVYGSTARGDALNSSDVDLLVVLEEKKGARIGEVSIPKTVIPLGKKPDFSYYSLDRLRDMFNSGHLFAWHLYREARFLEVGDDYLAQLSKPNDYESFEEDVMPLIELLSSIEHELERSRENLIYEAGLVYVCARNIAMCSSYFAPSGLSFSTYAPYLLGYSDNRFPLPKERFEALRRARLAGTRGLEPSPLDVDILVSDLRHVMKWARKEFTRVTGEVRDETAIC